MGIGTLGFVRGASRTALDSIEAREEAERQIKKEKDLLRFRNDLEQQSQMGIASTFLREDRDGKSIIYGVTKNGQRVPGAEREETADEAAARKTASEDKRLDNVYRQSSIDNLNSQIEDRKTDSARQERESRARIASLDRSNRPEASAADPSGVRGGRQLVSEYDKLVTDAIKAGANRGFLEQRAVHIAANASSGDAARQTFVKALTDIINAETRDKGFPEQAMRRPSEVPGKVDLNWR